MASSLIWIKGTWENQFSANGYLFKMPNNIAVVSVMIGELPYKEAALKNHTDYCLKHGYTYCCLEQQPLIGWHPMWMKPQMVLSALGKGYDVFWMDGDSFFMNHDIKLEKWRESSRADFIASGDHNDLVNTGHFFMRNTPWSISFVQRWLEFYRPLSDAVFTAFSPITAHFTYKIINGTEYTTFNDQPPIAIMLGGGSADNDTTWFEAFNAVNLYDGNFHRKYQASKYAPILPANLTAANSLVCEPLKDHVEILLQSEMNSYPDTYVQGDFILHFTTHKYCFQQILDKWTAAATSQAE